jgi:FkbM family methyltransferase
MRIKPKSLLRQFIGTAIGIARGRQSSPLPDHLLRQIERDRLRLLFLSPNSTQVRLCNFAINFRGMDQLEFLHREIFVEACYFFSAESDRPTIIDCGSNIGLSVFFFKNIYPNAMIMAFEPDPETFAILQKNVEQNRLTDVSLYECALMGRAGTIPFYRDPSVSNLKMSTNERRFDGQSITVEAQMLSQFVNGPIDLLKMDIEGAEHEVIDELRTTNKLSLIKAIHLEYHHNISDSGNRLSSMLNLLEEAGFRYQIKGYWSRVGFQDISIFCYRPGYVLRRPA